MDGIVARAPIANSYGSGSTVGRTTPHAGTWHEGLVLVIGSHVSALGFRRRELCGCHGFACVCEYSTAANVRMVMGGARGLAGGASGWSEIDG